MNDETSKTSGSTAHSNGSGATSAVPPLVTHLKSLISIAAEVSCLLVLELDLVRFSNGSACVEAVVASISQGEFLQPFTRVISLA